MSAVFCIKKNCLLCSVEKKKIVCEPYAHIWPTPGPPGGVFSKCRLFCPQPQPYAKLTSCMDIQYCINYCMKPYTKLTRNLHETYSYILLQTLHETYSYILLQNLHETYANLTRNLQRQIKAKY